MAVAQRFASPNPGSVNAYWFETSTGVIVVDSGRNVSGGHQVASAIGASGKRVLAIVITHGHPDHIGGLAVLREQFPDTPVYASRETDRVMREDPLGFLPLARMADPDYPAQIAYATDVFDDGVTLAIGGHRLKTRGYANAESISATVYHDRDAALLFVGDLLGEGVTPALLEGHTCNWLQRLDQLRLDYPDAGQAYPGHGEAGALGVQLDSTADYLRNIRALVRGVITAESEGGPTLTDSEKTALEKQVNDRYPNYPPVASLPDLIQVNLQAVGDELGREDLATLPAACQP